MRERERVFNQNLLFFYFKKNDNNWSKGDLNTEHLCFLKHKKMSINKLQSYWQNLQFLIFLK